VLTASIIRAIIIRLQVFENRVLRRIFGPKRDEVTGGWRRLHNEELHGLYSSPNIVRLMKYYKIRFTRYVARVGGEEWPRGFGPETWRVETRWKEYAVVGVGGVGGSTCCSKRHATRSLEVIFFSYSDREISVCRDQWQHRTPVTPPSQWFDAVHSHSLLLVNCFCDMHHPFFDSVAFAYYWTLFSNADWWRSSRGMSGAISWCCCTK
jgi:hypothetical protein